MSSIAQLYVDFASRGVEKVQQNLKALRAQMEQSRDRTQQLQAQLRALDLQNTGKTSKQKQAARLPVLKQLLQERQHLNQLTKVQQTLNREIGQQQEQTKKVAKGIGAVEGALNSVKSSFEHIGMMATAAFSGALASMLALASAADPTGWRMFRAEVEILRIEVGRIFLPILHNLTAAIRSVADWFHNLTPAQRQSIRMFSLLGLAILGAIAVVSAFGVAVVTAATTAIGAITLLATVWNAALTVSTGGLWGIVIAIGAIVTALVGLTGAAGVGGTALFVMGQKGEGVLDKIKNAIDALYEPITHIFEGFERVWGVLTEIGSSLLEVFKDTLGIGDETQFWADAMNVISGVFEVLGDVAVGTLRFIGATLVGLTELTMQVGKAMWDAFQLPIRSIEIMLTYIQRLAAALSLLDFRHPIDSGKAMLREIGNATVDMAKQISDAVTAPIRDIDLGKVAKRMNDFQMNVEKKDAQIKNKWENRRTEHRTGSVTDEPTMARAKAPQLLDVVEVWKKMQTAQQNDPMMKVAQRQLDIQNESLRQQRETNQHLNNIQNQRSGLKP